MLIYFFCMAFGASVTFGVIKTKEINAKEKAKQEQAQTTSK